MQEIWLYFLINLASFNVNYNNSSVTFVIKIDIYWVIVTKIQR